MNGKLIATSILMGFALWWPCCAAPGKHDMDAATVRGTVLLLPGISNTSLHLAPLAGMIGDAYPGVDVKTHVWGVPLFAWYNLSSYERNLVTAQSLAGELAALRREQPDGVINVVGFSGGGAMGLFAVRALPEDVWINRLVLIAPAVSHGYPLDTEVMPRVSECVINFASKRDMQVGWGTRTFGTMDRVNVESAGYGGFQCQDPRLIEVQWHEGMIGEGHIGDHLSYLSMNWQRRYIVPALDPALDLEGLRQKLVPAPNDEDDASQPNAPDNAE